ncbi:hypothetical protein JCM6882_004191 [Rhodosporidiobolus microsporus]
MGGGGVSSGGVRAAGPTLTKAQQYFAFGLVTSLFFLWGFSYSLVDVLNKKVQHAFGITKLQSTAIQIAYFGAYLVYSIPASMFASRFGYKKGVLMGLTLYVVGALLFWPTAHYEVFWPFPICAFVIGCGLATLETMANSYVSVLGDPKHAAFRLNFAQSFNGLATFIGPTIAAHTFFKDENSTDLSSVQFVYLGVACLGAAVFVLFVFAKLPEIDESAIEEAQENAGFVDERPLWKRKHTVFGFLCQWCYVGAQVTVATFVLNYLTDDGDYTDSKASQMFGYMQITFMVARFASIPVVRFLNPAIAVTIYGTVCTAFSLMAALTGGKPGLAALFIIFVGESIVYPTVFTLATANLGKHTKRGAGLLCMGVAGGAMFPPIQGKVADAANSRISYLVPTGGFSVIVVYGVCMYFYGRRIEHLTSGNVAGVEGGIQRNESLDKVEKEEVEAIEQRY